MCHEGFINNISCRRNKYEQTSSFLWDDSVSVFADLNFFNHADRTARAEEELKVFRGSAWVRRAGTDGRHLGDSS